MTHLLKLLLINTFISLQKCKNQTVSVNNTGFVTTHADLVSINFTQTLSSISQIIWPSDGFDIKYSLQLNNFRQNNIDIWDRIWYIRFLSVNNSIHTYVRLNTSSDHCICDPHKCHHCYQHYDLSWYLSLFDNLINQVQFVVDALDNNAVAFPDTLIIQLQRCNISLNIDHQTSIITYVNPLIMLDYSLSSNCYLRIDHMFAINISVLSLNISEEFNLFILPNKSISCDSCNNHKFIIQFEPSDAQIGEYVLSFESNMIDINVISSNNSFVFSQTKDVIHINNKLWFLLFVLIIPIIIMFIVYIHCKRE
eukprot:350068_1